MTASADLMEGWKALDEAMGGYETALAYFKGTAAERFTNRRVRELLAESGQAYQFRLAAKPVKVMAKRCRIATVTGDTEAVTKRLEGIRQANQAVIYESLIIRKTFIFGDAYALVWPVEPDGADRSGQDGDVSAEESVADVGVEITYQSPLHCRVVYDGEDGRRPRFAIRRWTESRPLGKVWRAELHYPDRVESWVTTPGASGGTAEEWHPYAEDDERQAVPAEEGVNWPLDNPWDEIAVKHFRTDLPYGEPAHEAAYGPQDAITKAITAQVVVDIEAHGWPERYRLLRDQKILEAGQEPVAWGDAASAPAMDPNRPMVAGRRRGSGVEHTYAGTEEVGEYTSPDPRVLIEPIDQWVRLMSVVTETPLEELDPTVQVSGVSRDKADAPTREKAKEAKAYLEGAWRELYGLAVRMTGMEPGTLQITWVPPEVTMDADWWETAGKRVDLGVPVKQILAEANYLPDQIKEWLDTQGEEMALAQRIGILERLGTAIQTLGVGVQLGVLDQGTVAGLVQRVVGQVESSDRAGT